MGEVDECNYRLKTFLNKYLFISKIVASMKFEMLMFIIILLNLAVMIWVFTEPSEPVATFLNSVDDYFLYIFTAEVGLRIVGTGFVAYFSDNWNRFDFTLVCISYATDVAMSTLTVAKNARTARFIKFTRLQRTLRMTKTIKGLRTLKFCFGLMQSFFRIKQLIRVILISIPSIWRTFSLIVLLFYIYSVIGMEIFRADSLVRPDSPVVGLTQFWSFEDSLLELLHVLIANGWSDLMYSYCIRYDMRTAGILFFISFHALVNIVLRSLLSGLVWEVFSFVEKVERTKRETKGAEEEEEEEETNEDILKSLHKNYFVKLRIEGNITLICPYELPEVSERIDGIRDEAHQEMDSPRKDPIKKTLQKFRGVRKSEEYQSGILDRKMDRRHTKRASLTNVLQNIQNELRSLGIPLRRREPSKGKISQDQKASSQLKASFSIDSEPLPTNNLILPTSGRGIKNNLKDLNLKFGSPDKNTLATNTAMHSPEMKSPAKLRQEDKTAYWKEEMFRDENGACQEFSDNEKTEKEMGEDTIALQLKPVSVTPFRNKSNPRLAALVIDKHRQSHSERSSNNSPLVSPDKSAGTNNKKSAFETLAINARKRNAATLLIPPVIIKAADADNSPDLMKRRNSQRKNSDNQAAASNKDSGKEDRLGTCINLGRKVSQEEDDILDQIFFSTLRSKFNSYDKALELLKGNKNIPKEVRYLMMNTSRSIFFIFFDKLFEKIGDIAQTNLGNKERKENVEKQNEEYMIKKAMMKGTKFEDIKKSEIKFLQEKYGNMVPDLSVFLNSHLLNGIHTRHRLAMLLHKSLKDPDLKPAYFLKVIYMIEKEINNNLIPEGSIFKFAFYDKGGKLVSFIKFGLPEHSNLSKYKVLYASSDYLKALTQIASNQCQSYYGFDALHVGTSINPAPLKFLKNFLDSLSRDYESEFSEKMMEQNLWSCLVNRVELDPADAERKDSSSSSKDCNPFQGSFDDSEDSDSIQSVSQVCLLNFYHFCQQNESKENKKDLVTRLKNVIMQRDIHNPAEDKKKKERQKKANMLNMPDFEYSSLMEDLSEIIKLHSKTFFSLADKLIYVAALRHEHIPEKKADIRSEEISDQKPANF